MVTMSIIDITEELVSEVDINAEFTRNGLSLSIYLDDVGFTKKVQYDVMAYAMLEDVDKYDEQFLTYFIHQLRLMANIVEEGIDGRE
jgi:hypothetical protein